MNKTEKWLTARGFVYDESDEVWEIPGAANGVGRVKKSAVDSAEGGDGVDDLIRNDANLQRLVAYRGVDQHPRIREWTRKGKVQ